MPGLSIEDAMSKNIVSISPDKTIQQAAKLMAKHSGGALIVKRDENPVGILTHLDIVKRVLLKDKKSSKTKVREVMTKDLHKVSKSSSLADAAKLMVSKDIKRLPVVNSENRIVGVIAAKDILRIAPSMTEYLYRKVKEVRETLPPREQEKSVTEGICELCGNYYQHLRLINNRWVCVECKAEAAEI